jgi:hypothetical protein
MTTHDTPEAAAITHREDDKPCGCDGCMEIGAEENGVDWWRLPKADRERLRRNSSGDDRLEPAPIHVYPVGEGHEMSEGCWCHPKVTAVTTHDTPEAALADALDAFDVVDYRIDPHGTPIGHDEAATAILAAMPDMMLVPRVATADWTGSTRKDADADAMALTGAMEDVLFENARLRAALEIIAAKPRGDAHEAIAVSARNIARAALAPAPSEP